MKRFHLVLLAILAFGSLVWAQEPPASTKPAEAQPPAASKDHIGSKHAATELEEGREVKEPISPEQREKIEKQETKDLIYKSINFVILFGLIIYFLAKPAKEFFESRTASIRKGMSDAAAAQEAAEKRLGEIEQKLAHLNDEIAALRAQAAQEDAVQAEIMRKATEAEGAKILAAAEAEIDVKTRTARLELKAYAAKLAIDLAEERIKNRMTPDAQGRLIASFVNDLADVSSKGGKN